MLTIDIIPILRDNYVFMLKTDSHLKRSSSSSGGKKDSLVGVVDPGCGETVAAAIDRAGGQLDYIINTHHHWDHTDGNRYLKARYGASVIGPAASGDRIRAIDVALRDGDTFSFGKIEFKVIETPGHTIGDISYYAKDQDLLFCGDTLFAMGCGRLFEGSAGMMWRSLQKLCNLPKTTKVYCTHEYTEANAAFALTVDSTNNALRSRVKDVARLRADNRPTIPSTVGLELATNPFLRPSDPHIRAALGTPDSTQDEEVFRLLRERKDSFTY